MQKRAYLLLEDGTTFEGYSFGYEGDAIGEAVFNTSMSGYQEVLTDPSYSGQIVVMTYPMIGNYGVNNDDVESSKVQVAGFVVKEYSKAYSSHRAMSSLDEYLKDYKIPGIEGIDTRRLTRHIRDKGAMRAVICMDTSGAMGKILAHPAMAGLDLTFNVMCSKPYSFGKNRSGAPTIAVFDFGVKMNILRLLHEQGCNVVVYPGNMALSQVLKNKDIKGVFLSNGPGDPDAVEYAKTLVNNIMKTHIPCFGICLGHQLIALGMGAKTYKLKFGHRGTNQPVKNLLTQKVEITSQNHGFAVDYESIKHNNDVEITHLNCNDTTVEGLRHKKLPIFSVQYHPEANPGPHDSRYLFKQFYELVTH